MGNNNSASTKNAAAPKVEEVKLEIVGDSVLLSEDDIEWLKSFMPAPDYKLRWGQLYNSDRHGKSYNRFLTHCLDRGPTIVIMRDKGGAVFGGFTSDSWIKTGSGFFGGPASFIFSIQPERKRYVSTGYNDHYMYCALGLETFPNGVGMGGQHGFHGWFVDASFDGGHSRGTCSTFASPSLSSMDVENGFLLDLMEVYSVYVKRDDDGAILPFDISFSKGKSILDAEGNEDLMFTHIVTGGTIGQYRADEPLGQGSDSDAEEAQSPTES
jgi:hypothetical protein